MILSVERDYLLKHHQVIYLCNGEVLCLLWDTDWILKYYFNEIRLQKVKPNVSEMCWRTKSHCSWIVDVGLLGSNAAWTCRQRNRLPPTSLQPWRWRQYHSSKRWYLSTSPHGVTIQKTNIDFFTNARTSRKLFWVSYEAAWSYWRPAGHIRCETTCNHPRKIVCYLVTSYCKVSYILYSEGFEKKLWFLSRLLFYVQVLHMLLTLIPCRKK
jgi:hypothetical protein